MKERYSDWKKLNRQTAKEIRSRLASTTGSNLGLILSSSPPSAYISFSRSYHLFVGCERTSDTIGLHQKEAAEAADFESGSEVEKQHSRVERIESQRVGTYLQGLVYLIPGAVAD